ncbi:MAG: trigger factor [Bacteroidetes bacterium]|nr:trigger factor [Bacteroidota bacterium]
MNITKEETGVLSACIRIDISPEDYQENVTKKLKEYQRKANVPGFRPGMVPINMIKKMYGKGLLVDEIDKLLRDSLESYLKDNNINTLGTPMANEEKSPEANWDEPSTFTFHFDIGIKPDFDLNLSPEINIDYYKIVPSAEELENEIENIRKSFGTFQEVDESDEGDWFNVELKELDENGQLLEGGITHSRRLTTTTFPNPEMASRMNGLKKGDQLVFNPQEAMNGEASHIGYLLNLDADKASTINTNFELTVNSVERIALADLTKDIFDKIFPGENIETEEDFRRILKEDMSRSNQRESDTTFYRAVRKKLLETVNFPVPEEFLRRWINEKEHDHDHEHDHKHEHDHEKKEEKEPDFEKIFESMRWQLIENKLFEQHNIHVDYAEIKNHVKMRYRAYFEQQGGFGSDSEQIDKTLDRLAEKFLEKKEEAEEIMDMLYINKLLDVFKNNLTLENKEVTHDEFHEISGDHHENHDHH